MDSLLEYLWIFGAVVVAAVAFQMLWLTVDMARRSIGSSGQRKREADLLSLQLEVALKKRGEEEQESQSWLGHRKFLLSRKTFEDQNREVCSFYLKAHDGKAIADYQPGQFLTFQCAVPDQRKQLVRCYSLSDCYRDDHYRVTIKRALPPSDNKDAQPGIVSFYMLDHLETGAILDVQVPKGRFFLDTIDERPIVLIGGGIGITPMIAMMNHVAESGSLRETWVYYGIRNRGEQIMKDHVKEITRNRPNIRVRICYSRPSEEDAQGSDYDVKGRVNVDLLKKELPSNNYDFFICGPGAMMETMVSGLEEWGVPPDRIHTEAFGPSRARKPKKIVDAASSTGPAVTFRKSNKVVNWDPQMGYLWDFADAHDVRIDSGCLEGDCGQCEVAILKGEIEYTKKAAFQHAPGNCLTCCCVPKGPVELDA